MNIYLAWILLMLACYGMGHLSYYLTLYLLGLFGKYTSLSRAVNQFEKALKKSGWNGKDRITLHFKDKGQLIIEVIDNE